MTQAKQTITVRSYVGRDGILHLEVPVAMREMDLEVTVTVQPVGTELEGTIPEALGWPEGVLQRTAGSIPELERPPQGEYEQRDTL